MNEENIRVKIVADDMASDKGFVSKYVGKSGLIIGWKTNPKRNDGRIPIIKLDDGTEICDPKIWWTKE